MKKFLSIVLTIVLIMCTVPMGAFTICVNAVSFEELNSSNVFLKQEGSTTCTLSATTMMMRRYSMLRGDSGWNSITESSVKPIAWINGEGLRWSFSYSNSYVSNISVGHYTLPGGSANEALIQAELKNCPEGIVIYNTSVPHAVLLTDYSNGTYYCADPLGSIANGRIPLTSAYKVRINNVTAYWKVTSPVVDGPTTTSHTCNKGEYVYYEAAHPHYKCYRCSICGVVWRNTSEPVIVPSCSSCTHTHSYSSSITKQPTCTATGIRTYKCSCGKSYTETISALGHDYSGDRLQEAAHPHQISQRCVRYSTCGGFYWTGENGYSSNCESCKKKSTKIYLWTSNTKMGDSGQTIRTGDWIYLCYKIYDENSGAMFDTYNTNGYTVKLTLYEVDGSVAHTATYSSDDSYIGIQRYTEGKYRGELVFTFNNGGTTTITVYQNLIYEPRVTPSVNDIYLNVAGTNSQTIDISYSGATKSDSIYVDCTTTGDCFNYSWGSWNNHKMPLTVTGIKAGNGTITVRLRDYDTKEILATAEVRVTVKAPTYVVNYDANGGTGAPSSQIKYHNVTLTLSDIKPQRKGYTFLGWSTNSNATSASYQPKGSFTSNSDTTLRAVWKKGCENNSHNYNYKVATAPTTSATGSLIGICSLCQSTTNVTLPKLSTSYYDYSVIKSATCTTSGTGRYVLDTSSYGRFYFDVTISANKHSYGSWAYKDSGYHIHYCTDCGAWEKSLHTYSNKCDSECNICGGTRIPSDHVYDNGIDEFCNVCGAQRKLHIAGDTNGDGKISGKDYALLLQSINGWDVTISNDAADVTSDGKINGKDYAMLLQYINGWDVVLK